MWLVSGFVRTFPKLLAEIGERFCKRTLGESPGGLADRPFGGTKSAHVDPGFASDRGQFRLEGEREFLLGVAVERETHPSDTPVPPDYLIATTPSRLFPDSRITAFSRYTRKPTFIINESESSIELANSGMVLISAREMPHEG